MKKDKHKTEVIFRLWKGEIIALFPYSINDTNGNVESYMHVGQHGGADYFPMIRSSKPASKEEYIDLFNELESIGYNLNIIKRRSYSEFSKRWGIHCHSLFNSPTSTPTK